MNPLTKMRIHYYWRQACRKPVINSTGRNAILINVFVLFMFFLINIPAFAADSPVTLGWDPNEEPDLVGYNVYWKTHVNESYDKTRMSEILEQDFDNPLVPRITFWFPKDGMTYYFVATAFNGTVESVYSNEIQWTAPMPNNRSKKKSKSGGGSKGCFISTLTEGENYETENWFTRMVKNCIRRIIFAE